MPWRILIYGRHHDQEAKGRDFKSRCRLKFLLHFRYSLLQSFLIPWNRAFVSSFRVFDKWDLFSRKKTLFRRNRKYSVLIKIGTKKLEKLFDFLKKQQKLKIHKTARKKFTMLKLILFQFLKISPFSLSKFHRDQKNLFWNNFYWNMSFSDPQVEGIPKSAKIFSILLCSNHFSPRIRASTPSFRSE